MAGVEEIKIEAESGRVTVAGSGIEAKTVIQRLQKYGKTAEVWPMGGNLGNPGNPGNLGNLGRWPMMGSGQTGGSFY